jgi:hypothetical protein
MSIASEKLKALRADLLSDQRKGGALLVVYPPEEELAFRAGYEDIIQELESNDIETDVLDFRTLVLDALEQRDLLQRAFWLDAKGSRDVHQNLAGMVQRETLRHVCEAAQRSPRAVLCCSRTVSLYPWISYSALLEDVEHRVANKLVIPFPGTQDGPALRFLGAKDGFNYRAARI